jgi:SAM-dependent methyltransferase
MQRPLKNFIQRWCWPLMPGWPDEGRRIVQGTHLSALLERASKEQRFRYVFNAGAGEGSYTRLLLGLPGMEFLVESDIGWSSGRGPKIDPRQLFFCSSLTHVPLSNVKFDFILCTEVLEHIADHELALDEITRLLSPGGWLLITVPTPPAVPDPNHVREGYRPAELAALLTERGFEIVDSRFCMYFFFRFLLKNWSPSPWYPRILIRSLAYLDRLLPIGPPMDLMLLGRIATPNRQGTKTISVPEKSLA